MLSTLILIATLTVGSLWLVDSINHVRHQEKLLTGLMHLAMAQVISDEGDTTIASSQLGLKLRFDPLSTIENNTLKYERLKSGQLILESLGEGASVQLPAQFKNETWVLSAYFLDFRSSHMRGALHLLRQLLARVSEPAEEIIPEYSRAYGIPMRLLNQESMSAYDLTMNEVTPPNHVRRYSFSTDSSYYYAWLPDVEKLLEVGPVQFRHSISIQGLFVVFVMAILLTGISVYWLVHSFELRLQRLERATSRIAQGHLNSRVKLSTVDSVGRLGMAFNRMAEQIQRLMSVQREMIRAVSHELRTPVARMRFGVQMLEDTVEDKYVQKQLSAMDGDIQELDELIDEILTYARLEEGGPILEFKHANVMELVDQVVDETRRRTDKVEINSETHVVKQEDFKSEIEFRYLHRAVQNLVGNACRYASSKVQITYGFENDICRIDVEDDGPGIPEEDWERVFSPFTRLDDSRTRSTGGYGLGLSIVQRIIYWHSGRALVGRSRWGGAKMSLIWPKLTQSKSA